MSPEPAAPEPAASQASPVRFHRLLVAVDGSEHGALALGEAIALAQRNHATVTVLSVASHAPISYGYVAVPAGPAVQKGIDDEVQGILRSAAAEVGEDVSVDTAFRRGPAGPEIIAEIRDGNYDAVLLGSRGLGRVASFLGSVSQHVLHHADIAVLIAHAPEGR